MCPSKNATLHHIVCKPIYNAVRIKPMSDKHGRTQSKLTKVTHIKPIYVGLKWANQCKPTLWVALIFIKPDGQTQCKLMDGYSPHT